MDRSLVAGLRAALLITAKDLRQRVRDRSAWLFAVVVPFGLAVIFSLVLPGFEAGDVAVRVGVVGTSPTAERFAASLEDLDVVTGVERVADEQAATSALSASELDVAVLVPADLADGPGGTLEVLARPGETVASEVGRSLAAGLAHRVDAAVLAAIAARAAGASGGRVADAARLAAAAPSPVQVVGASTAPRQLDATTYLAAGMAVFFLFFTVQLGVTSLLEERQRGTWTRLRAAPVPPWSVVAGKVLTSIVLGLISMAVLIVGTSALLGASWGDPVAVAVLTAAGVLAACSLVAVVGKLARTAEQAGAWQSIVAIVLGMLGGAFFPLDRGTGLVAALTDLSPHAWYLRGLGDLAAGAGVRAVTTETAVLVAFAGGGVLLAAVLPARWARS